jgi:hypothetical protein
VKQLLRSGGSLFQPIILEADFVVETKTPFLIREVELATNWIMLLSGEGPCCIELVLDSQSTPRRWQHPCVPLATRSPAQQRCVSYSLSLLNRVTDIGIENHERTGMVLELANLSLALPMSSHSRYALAR